MVQYGARNGDDDRHLGVDAVKDDLRRPDGANGPGGSPGALFQGRTISDLFVGPQDRQDLQRPVFYG